MTRESEHEMPEAFAVSARELSWLCWCSSYFCLPPFSGCSQASAFLAFKVGMGLLCEGVPVYPVHGRCLKLLCIWTSRFNAGLYIVFVALLRPALDLLSLRELSKEWLLQYSQVIYSYNMPCPKKLCYEDHGLCACVFAQSRTSRFIWGCTCGCVQGASCKVSTSNTHTRGWWEQWSCTLWAWLTAGCNAHSVLVYACIQGGWLALQILALIPLSCKLVIEIMLPRHLNSSTVFSVVPSIEIEDEKEVDSGCNSSSVFPSLIVRSNRWQALTDLSMMSWSDSLCTIMAQSSANSAIRIILSSVLVFALRCLRLNNDPSSLYLRYTPCSRSLTAWLSIHVKNRLNRTGTRT